MLSLFLTPTEVKAVHEKLNLSQSCFCSVFTGVTTLQNWEQGIVKPNKQSSGFYYGMVEKDRIR